MNHLQGSHVGGALLADFNLGVSPPVAVFVAR